MVTLHYLNDFYFASPVTMKGLNANGAAADFAEKAQGIYSNYQGAVVVTETIPKGDAGVGLVSGVIELPKRDASQVFGLLDLVWNMTTSEYAVDNGEGTDGAGNGVSGIVGIAIEPSGAGDATVKVLLNAKRMTDAT